MPRNIGTDIYYIPPGTEGFPDTTIESEKYNTYIHDIETDLNTPRPVSAGGTGADDDKDARANLHAEVAGQKVDSYDAHVWESGSFWSPTSATAGPVDGHTFGGTCIIFNNDPNYIVLEARDETDLTQKPGKKYVREKKAGVWDVWRIDSTGTAADEAPTNLPEGSLWWNTTDGQLYFNYDDGTSRQWVIASPVPDPAQYLMKAGDTMLGNLALASTPVAAMDAANKAYVDAANTTKVSKTGDTMTGALTVTGSYIRAAQSANAGTYYFGNDPNRYLYFDGTNYNFGTGNVNIPSGLFAGDLTSNGNIAVILPTNPPTGTIYFGNAGRFMNYDGTNWNVSGGANFFLSANVQTSGQVVSSQNFVSSTVNLVLAASGNSVVLRPRGAGSAVGQVAIDANGSIAASGQVATGTNADFVPTNGSTGGFRCKDGVSQGISTDYFNLLWISPATYLYIDQSQMGIINIISDYRTKKDVTPLPSTWDAVKALKPIKYTHKDFTPPSQAAKSKETGKPFITGDEEERWGFIAHELQETLVESAATAKKDAPSAIQSPNPLTIIAALTKALQEAMTRIEALEAKAGA